MAYAEDTAVSVEKSKAEIEKLLLRHGADQFVSGHESGRAMVQFRKDGRFVRFVLTLPDPKEKRFHQTPSGKWSVPAERAHKLWEQACRAKWRALCLCIKAKLEAVAASITTFETEFMPHTVMPDGKTFAQHALPAIAKAYETGKIPQLLTFEGEKRP